MKEQYRKTHGRVYRRITKNDGSFAVGVGDQVESNEFPDKNLLVVYIFIAHNSQPKAATVDTASSEVLIASVSKLSLRKEKLAREQCEKLFAIVDAMYPIAQQNSWKADVSLPVKRDTVRVTPKALRSIATKPLHTRVKTRSPKPLQKSKSAKRTAPESESESESESVSESDCESCDDSLFVAPRTPQSSKRIKYTTSPTQRDCLESIPQQRIEPKKVVTAHSPTTPTTAPNSQVVTAASATTQATTSTESTLRAGGNVEQQLAMLTTLVQEQQKLLMLERDRSSRNHVAHSSPFSAAPHLLPSAYPHSAYPPQTYPHPAYSMHPYTPPPITAFRLDRLENAIAQLYDVMLANQSQFKL